MEEINFVVFAIMIAVLFIICVIYTIWDYATRPKRFAEALEKLKSNGFRIVYKNESTGTISYTKNGVRHQMSVYQGYNSRARYY